MRQRARTTTRLACAIAFGVALFATPRARADEAAPPGDRPRPIGSESWPRACSFRHPVCAHATRADARRIPEVLAALDRAWDLATGALGLPPPFASVAAPYDVYLVDDALGGGQTFVAERDATASFDRARAFSVLTASLPRACALDHAATRELLRAVQIAAVPATDEGTARAQTESLARLVAPCPSADLDGIAEFQRYDARALVDPLPEAPPTVGDLYDRGASLFFSWLDDQFGNEPGSTVRAMWSLAPTKGMNNHPNAFDVLRSTFKGTLGSGATVDDLFVDFALARPALTPIDVRLEFDDPWPREPVRYLSPNPPMTTGASYLRIRKNGAPDDARIRFEIEWEAHARMRWTVVKLDAASRTIGTLPISAMDRGTDANITVNDLRGVDSVLLVGVALPAPDRVFDPNDRDWEPHAWTVTVAAKAPL